MISLKHQPGCKCCKGCIWLHKDWHTETPDPVPASTNSGDSRLSLAGGAQYDSTRKRIQIPGGGELASVKGSPHVAFGSVAVLLRLEDLSDPAHAPTIVGGDGYGYGYEPTYEFAENPHIRIYFESDEARENYRFVDVSRKVMSTRGSAVPMNQGGIKSAWILELGVRVDGVDTVQHYGLVAAFSTDRGNKLTGGGEDDADGKPQEHWISLQRTSPYPEPEFTERFNGYAAFVSRESDQTGWQPDVGRLRIPAVDDLDYGAWQGASSFYGAVGVGLEQPLSDPAGTHFGIVRLDAETLETEIAAFVVGKHQYFGGNEGFFCKTAKVPAHGICLESSQVEFVPLINGAHELGGEDDYEHYPPTLWGNHGNRDCRIHADVLGVLKEYGPTITYWDIRFWIPDPMPLRGFDDNPTLSIQIEVIEWFCDATFGPAEYARATRAYNILWNLEIPLNDHALECSGFVLDLHVDDATVTASDITYPMQLETLRWTASVG